MLHIDTRTEEEKKQAAYAKAKTPDEKLIVAAEYGDISIAHKCIATGAQVNPGPGKPTPLYLAVVGRQFAMVRLLVETYNADVNGINTIIPGTHGMFNTPLHLACSIGEKPFEILDYLLSRKANPNALDSDGKTPLHEAASEADRFNYIATVEGFLKRLIAAGADTQIKTKHQKFTPFELGQWHINNHSLHTPEQKKELIARLENALAFKPSAENSYKTMLQRMPVVISSTTLPSPAVSAEASLPPIFTSVTSELVSLRSENNVLKKENAALKAQLANTGDVLRPPSPR